MLLIIAAVPVETALLRSQLENSRQEEVGSCRISIGSLCGHQVLLAHSGIGLAAMSLQLTRLLERYPLQTVLLCGCGGSYPGSDLQNGDLALASEEIFGDLGVALREDFIHLTELGIPQQAGQMLLAQPNYPLQSPLTEMARKILPQAAYGPFVSLNSCSGHEKLSEQLAQRCSGICENMEGAAAAQVCHEYQIPLLELRGISNPTGTRDSDQWEIRRGAEAAQQGLLQILKKMPPQQQDEPCAN